MTPGWVRADGWRLDRFWGFLGDREALAQRYRGGPADTELLAAAIHRDGLAVLEQLAGQFAAIFRNDALGASALARDALGTIPLFYARTPFAADADLPRLRAELGINSPDRWTVANYLNQGSAKVGTRTQFEDISRVPPGAVVLIPDQPAAPTQTWRHFRPEQVRMRTELSPEQSVDVMRSAIRLAVDDAIRGRRLAAHVSGGLDCGLVTALAKERAPILASYTWIPWPPEQGGELAPEQQWVAATAAGLGLDPVYADAESAEGRWRRQTDPLDYPSWGYLNYEGTTLPLARQAGADTILSGWGGDDFASAYALNPLVYLAAGEWRAWLGQGRARADLHGRPVMRSLGLRTLVRRRTWLPRPITSAGRQLAARLPYPGPRMETWWLAGQRFGIEYRYPLLDRRVLDAACAMPPWFFGNAGWSRWGFRTIAAASLPASVAWNPSKTELLRVSRLVAKDPWLAEIERVRTVYPELVELYSRQRERVRRRHQHLLPERGAGR